MVSCHCGGTAPQKRLRQFPTAGIAGAANSADTLDMKTEKDVLNILSYESKAAFHQCYSALWVEMLPPPDHRSTQPKISADGFIRSGILISEYAFQAVSGTFIYFMD